MATQAPSADWLQQVWWREAWLTLEAAAPARLPAFLGSTLRGALGHLLRAALCEGSGCGHTCRQPDSCRYYALFERTGEGPKPLLLEPPAPPGLEEIALGGPVYLPYRTGDPKGAESIPTLRCDAEQRLERGATLDFGIRLVGPLSQTLPAVLDAVARFGLSLAGTPFQLLQARDDVGNLLYDRRFPALPAQSPAARRIAPETLRAHRICLVFLTPTLFKLDQAPTFHPLDFASRFFEHSLGRAVRMHRACAGSLLSWVDATPAAFEMTAHRLFHYQLPRHSYRQDQWLSFDGVVGWLDLAGDFGDCLRWGRAAEVFHFGQKAAFGLGRVRMLILE